MISACFALKGVRRDGLNKRATYYEPEFYDARGVLKEIIK
ncbi:artA domain protein [Escherichia coli 1-182-04_S1_C3]|nr:artA domain protein [Escherichia coli 1-182-04_S1_C3]EZK31838.1 artA domain protein [Escherichia coli 1-182-04_S1_C1]